MKTMDTLEYDKEYWNQPCPRISCKKDVCKCGLKKVVLAAALGDDSKTSPIAPKNGAYCNAIVAYEANGNIYIYSSDGVPTLVRKHEEDVEAAIYNLQKQIDDIKNSPDVVDIVATYADLQAYDTSKLGDNDIIRVLVDETHDDESTYYRWDKDNNVWIYIGGVGPYYTKAAADAQFVPQTRTVNGKALSSNITLNASDVNALSSSDVVQTAGSSTTQVMSQKATTDALGLKLNISDYVVDAALADSTNPVQNKVLYGLLGNMPSDFFTGPVTVNGNGRDITLNGTMNAKLSDVKMYGDTFQQTYSGKNLIPYPYASSSSSPRVSAGITFIDNGDGTITINGQNDGTGNSVYYLVGGGNTLTLPAGTYYANTSAMFSTGGTITMYDGSSYRGLSLNNPSITLAQETTFTSVYYQITRNNTLSLDNVKFYPIMSSVSGETVENWEPYVGGTASPNPDYPQDVQTVTGTQTVEVTGKNLINSAESHNSINSSGTILSGDQYLGVTNYVPCKPNTDYAVSFQHETSDLNLYVGFKDKDGNFIIRNGYGTLRTFTTPDGATSMFFYMTKTGATPSIGGYAMLEYGSTVSQFEPYQGATYTVDLGATELCKIGTYQDYIYKSGDDWYVHKATGKYTFTGSETFNKSGYTTATSWVMWWVTSALVIDVSVDNGFCEFGEVRYLNAINSVDNGVVYNNTTGSTFVKLLKTMITGWDESATDSQKISLASAMIAGKSFYYPLATPTDTKITNADLISDLNALWNALSYDGQTNIAITASGLSGILDVTAFKKTLAGLIGAINRS